MSIELKWEGDLLIVTVSGTWTKSDHLQSREKVRSIFNEIRITNILYDIRKTTIPISLLELFEFASSNSIFFPRGICQAIVFSPTTFSCSNARFAETVACNRGSIMKWFNNINDAKKWCAKFD